MTRVTLYSGSPRPNRAAPVAGVAAAHEQASPQRPNAQGRPAGSEAEIDAARHGPGRPSPRRLERLLWLAGGVLGALVIVLVLGPLTRSPLPISPQDVDARVSRAIDRHAAISPAARAYRIIAPAVVSVRVFGTDGDETEDASAEAEDASADTRGIGTGVVIVDEGIILTNLHVVEAAKRIRVVFLNGHESDATLVGARPEHDLAVLRAEVVPDDLVVATMRSTADLAPGTRVVAVGFPFGLGPSVSAGVVSGLKRDFTTPEGERVLSNLIQFDAAANPGSSGGPLVTMDGEVVGIVTGILNPSGHGVFAGIGFAVPIENAAAAAGLSPF